MKPMMFFRLTKVDEEKREVWGRATQEVVDKANEIFDYASSKPFFERWSEGFAKDTDGRSLGNIRSMHSKVAAGKVIHIDFNDAEKAIDIGTKIIDNNEWEKVMEGVHTGFSIGGSYEKRWTDTASGATRFTAKPAADGSAVAVVTPDPTRGFVLTTGPDEVTLVAGAPSDSPDLALPAEAFARLVYGRLDPDHTPAVRGTADLAELRAVFPGP